jgi:hypothetical protein
MLRLQERWRNRLLSEIKEALQTADPTSMTKEERLKFKQDWKINLVTNNGWLDIPDIELFQMFPKDELHHWWLGLFGDHIIPAIIYRYIRKIQRKFKVVTFSFSIWMLLNP